jgi:multidrug resistance protein, MATE family
MKTTITTIIHDILEQSSPLTLSSILTSIGVFVETLLISQFDDQQSDNNYLAASALILSFRALMRSTPLACLRATSIIIKEQESYGLNEEVGRTLRQGMMISGVFASPFMLSLLSPSTVFDLLRQRTAVFSITEQYFRGYLLGFPFTLMILNNNQMLAGLLKTKITAINDVSNKIMTLLFGYCLGFGKLGFPRLGVKGIGYGYSLASFLTFVGSSAYLATIYPEKKPYCFKRDDFNKEEIYKLLQLGLPISVQVACELITYAVISFLSGQQKSESDLAAIGITNRYILLEFVTISALAQSAAILVKDYSIERGPNNARKLGNVSILMGCFIPTIFLAGYFTYPNFFTSIFSSDSQILAQCRQILPIAGIGQLLEALRYISAGALRGTEETKYSMKVSMFSNLCVAVPIIALLKCFGNATPVNVFLTVDFGLIIAACLMGRKWKKAIDIKCQSLPSTERTTQPSFLKNPISFFRRRRQARAPERRPLINPYTKR